MEEPAVYRRAIKIGTTSINLYALEAKNAIFILIYEGSVARAGTLAIAVPSYIPTSSSIIIGEKYPTTCRIFAEKLARTTGKIVILSIFGSEISEGNLAKGIIELYRECRWL